MPMLPPRIRPMPSRRNATPGGLTVGASVASAPVTPNPGVGTQNVGWGTVNQTSGASAGGGLPTGRTPSALAPGQLQKAIGATGATPPAATPQMSELDKLRQDIMDSHKNAWGGIQSGITANTALQQRRAAAMSAGMGRSVAGGYGGMMAQAMLGGQQNMLNAQLAHEGQGRQLQMGFLDQKIRDQERYEDREFALAGEGGDTPTATASTTSSQGAAGSWEGHSGGPVTSGYVSRHFQRVMSENGAPYSASDQQAVNAYINSYYQRTGMYPSTETIVRNAIPGRNLLRKK